MRAPPPKASELRLELRRFFSHSLTALRSLELRVPVLKMIPVLRTEMPKRWQSPGVRMSPLVQSYPAPSVEKSKVAATTSDFLVAPTLKAHLACTF